MKKRFYFIFSLILLVSFSALAETKIIAHPSVSNNAISTYSLDRIYAMQLKNWQDGENIKVFVLPSNHPLHRQFTLKKLKLQTHQLDRLWNRLIFTGTGRTPTVVNSEAEMLQKVKTTPGAIGYVGEHFAIDGVKVLSEGVNND